MAAMFVGFIQGQTTKRVSLVPGWCHCLTFLRSPPGRNGDSDAIYCVPDILHL